jgi:hypothetical protein
MESSRKTELESELKKLKEEAGDITKGFDALRVRERFNKKRVKLASGELEALK